MITLLLTALLAQDAFEKKDAEATKKLETARLSMTMSDCTIEDAVAFIHDFMGLALFVDPVGVPKPKEMKIDLEAKKAPIGTVLRDALTVHELDWTVLDGVVVVTSKKGREVLEKGLGDVKKDKELWAKLRGPMKLEDEMTLADALKKTGELSGLTMKTGALKKELLEEKVASSPELSVLGCLRLLAWQKGLGVEIKAGMVTLTK
jgi:hypothetical protein